MRCLCRRVNQACAVLAPALHSLQRCQVPHPLRSPLVPPDGLLCAWRPETEAGAQRGRARFRTAIRDSPQHSWLPPGSSTAQWQRPAGPGPRPYGVANYVTAPPRSRGRSLGQSRGHVAVRPIRGHVTKAQLLVGHRRERRAAPGTGAERRCPPRLRQRQPCAERRPMAAAMAEQEGARNGARNRGGVQRVEGKLRASVEKGDYYEAHQMYRTLFFRYMSQNKHAEARELMCSGALLFFSHGQQNSAADLSMLVLESLEKAEVEVAEELLESLARLFSLMDPNSPERVAFVSRALKWSGGGSGRLGHPRLHQLLALTLWREQNYCESRYHFLHSTDGEGCANMLVEYSTARGFRSEVDMFVAQAVLQFLCLKNKSSASVVFATYTQKHPSIEDGPPFVQPLLNFIWFLLLAVDGGKLTVFTVLCEQYQPSLRRDPMYNEYLDRIGQLFFGVPPKQTSSYGGLLGNLLSSLMGSSEQEGEDSQDDSSPIELD
ncbi:Golgi to ER traffic protein 4 homolog [Artibeus jamaicensis]|uniref:Golgi to ER traffic protein 4 homolog n=1 Tax=Artibeus jamaicensis TaxID=9417 RepID=UPI00235A66AF|nr:Golgi to ER traffic protein 4 homolog [Artibeus jamaicensis]